jgi:hypothetical protein
MNKEKFYVFVEEQHDDPEEVTAFDDEEAALNWVSQWERDCAYETGIAVDGEKITVNVFTLPEYANAKRSKDKHRTEWLECSHSSFKISGEYVANYYVEENF